MDRDELEERIRTRRPGEGGLRRGTPLDEDERAARAGGYVPFVPEPEDSMAVREEEEEPHPAPNVDNAPPDIDLPRHDAPVQQPPEPHGPATVYAHPPEPFQATEYPEDDAPYGAPEDAYPYPYRSGGDGRRRGTSVLPILGFILLCVLALGVGAVLASVLGGPGQVAQATPTPAVEGSMPASVEPTLEPTASASGQASAPPEPTNGPITFPDGAQLSIQPCGSSEFEDDAVGRPEENACQDDSSSIEDGEVWAFIVFADTPGSDSLTVQLLENDQVLDEQEMTIDEVLRDCGSSCNGLIYGAHYAGLFSGDYELVLQREGEFADSATFTVE
jgi:hypothetical protein